VARDALLEVDDAEAVEDRLRLVSVREAPDELVREVEADPDADLEAEITPTAWEHAAARCHDGAHIDILRLAADVRHLHFRERCRLGRPELGIPVRAPIPDGSEQGRKLLVRGSEPQRGPQIVAFRGEKAGVKAALGRKTGPGAATAEGLG